MSPPVIVVVAAVIEEDGRLLVTRRQRGTHLEGCWEFPGGKREPGETNEQALGREIVEELGAGVVDPREVFVSSHVYPDRSVELHFFRCALGGPPRPQLGQELRWVRPADLLEIPFPPADAEFIQRFLLS